MSKHTPGPWDMKPCSAGGGLLIRGDAGKHSQASLQIVPIEDARLIAAAPEMLEALDRLLWWASVRAEGLHGTELDAINSARAAIAKATGEA